MPDESLPASVSIRLEEEQGKISALEGMALKPIEKRRLRTIRAFAAGTMRREPDSADKVLINEFLLFGAQAILSTGSMRAGDFLNNQLRGRWAETVVLSMNLPSFRFVPFGPSGAAMPGQEDHRRIITTFREIEMIEGKRPDAILYDARTWGAFSTANKETIREWPTRLLKTQDVALLQSARCGVEVKSSTWHYARRRERRATLDTDDEDIVSPLSITVKDEELVKIIEWIKSIGRPMLFFQVMFDEIYCMSFSRMVDGIRNNQVYAHGDYLKDAKTGAGKKVYHRFALSDTRHRCAFVRFPDKSKAVVEVLASGSVIPYVDLQPAQAYDEDEHVVMSELRFAETALQRGLPELPPSAKV